MAFGGRSGLRAISDRSKGYRRFASAVGIRLIGAGVVSLAQAAMPSALVDAKGRTHRGLRTLFEGRVRTNLTAADEWEQERTLIVVLAVSIWAAMLPWLAGTQAMLSGFLSFLALAFPVLFLLTAPSGRIRKSTSGRQKGRSTR